MYILLYTSTQYLAFLVALVSAQNLTRQPTRMMMLYYYWYIRRGITNQDASFLPSLLHLLQGSEEA